MIKKKNERDKSHTSNLKLLLREREIFS